MCKKIVSESSKVFAELEKKLLQPVIELAFIKVNGKVSSFRRQVKAGGPHSLCLPSLLGGTDPILLAEECQRFCLLSVTLYVWAENRIGTKS